MATVAEATFRLNTLSDVARVAASSVSSIKGLEKEIESVQSRIAARDKQIKGLIGNNNEVKAAKKELIELNKSEKDVLGKLRLEQIKLGDASESASKKAEVAHKTSVAEMAKSWYKIPTSAGEAWALVLHVIKDAGIAAIRFAKTSPAKVKESFASMVSFAKELPSKIKSGFTSLAAFPKKAFEGFKNFFSSASNMKGGLASMLSGSGSVIAGLAGIAGGAAIAAIAIAALAVGLGAAAIKMADTERSAALMRQAVMGSSQQSKALGTWVDGLAQKLPLAREEINAMGVALGKAGLSGDRFTTALEAQAVAKAAMGDELASKVNELTTRYKRMNVFQLGRLELDGTGLNFDDVATALSKSTGKGVQDARRMLAEGRLPLAAGAAAIRDAIKTKFGDVIEKRNLSLSALSERAKGNLAEMFQGVNIEPFLKSLSKLVGLFDSSTSTGKILSKSIEFLATTFADYAAQKIEMFTQGIKLTTLGILKLSNYALETWINIRKGDGPLARIAAFLERVAKLALGVREAFEGMGNHIVAGLKAGLSGGGLEGIGKALAESVAKGFEKANEIKSPSRRFMRYGKHIAAGVALGIAAGSSDAVSASEDMLSSVSLAAQRGGQSSSSTPSTIVVNVSVSLSSSDARGAAASFEGPEFKSALTRVLREAVKEARGAA